MDRLEIGKAHTLFYERDRLDGVLRAVESGTGLAVCVSGNYLGDAVLAVAREPLANYFRSEIKKIDASLKQLGWSGR